VIAAIRGELFEVGPETCLVMVGNPAGCVGYELTCSLSSLAELQGQMRKDVFLYVYTHVREDALQLFGFLNLYEKDMFLSLLKVNGIGPKSALNILSGAQPAKLAELIEQEDVKALSKLPKVGKKTAEQMILTLKGKLVLSTDSKTASSKTGTGVSSQISSALINLGFRSQDVEKVVSDFEPNISIEEGVRQGLAALTQI
jgi:Holliday junction DNA helicase RuvA